MITFLKCDAETAGVTSKGPGTSERAGVEGFHSFLSSGGWGHWMVSTDTNSPSETLANCGLFSGLQDFSGGIRTLFHA
jgi:hypothetical protein